ncbi:unnamed protein product, partial [Scytosiphon promiscuus]
AGASDARGNLLAKQSLAPVALDPVCSCWDIDFLVRAPMFISQNHHSYQKRLLGASLPYREGNPKSRPVSPILTAMRLLLPIRPIEESEMLRVSTFPANGYVIDP